MEERAFAAATRLDEKEEIQWVMGDLSALKTAAQTYYSDANDSSVPPLASILDYFDPESLPPDASSLYALKGNERGWYVGYRTTGLKNETYSLLQDNAQTLGLLCDDLRTPWRQGSLYFWSEALALSSNPAGRGGRAETSTTVVVKRSPADDIADVADLIYATASLIGVIDDVVHHRYYYYVPGQDWYWHSALVYRPAYYYRFFGSYWRPLGSRSRRAFPVPGYRYETSGAGRLHPLMWQNSMRYTRQHYDPRHDSRSLGRPFPGQRRWTERDPLPVPRMRLRPKEPRFRDARPRFGDRPGNGDHRSPQFRRREGREGRPGNEDRRPSSAQRPPEERRGEQRQPPRIQRENRRPGNEDRRPPSVQRSPQPQQNRPEVRRPSESRRPSTPERPSTSQRPNGGALRRGGSGDRGPAPNRAPRNDAPGQRPFENVSTQRRP